MLATYTLFYIMTVYSMTFCTAAAPVGLGLPRNEVLWMLMMAVIGFGVMGSRNRTGYVHYAGNLYAVLHHDGLLYDL